MSYFAGVMALLLIIVLVAIMVCRVFGIKKAGALLEFKGKYKGEKTCGKDILAIGGEALFLRILMYLVCFLLLRLVYMIEDQTFLEWWTKWDATNYIGIAEGGYSEIKIDDVVNMGNDIMQTLVFLPLYPVLVAGINFIVGDVYVSALVTSTICFVTGAIFMYMAVAKIYGKSIAEKAVTLLSVFPFAFYYGGMLPESTFFMVTAICIYFTIERKWLLAGIAGAFCGIARLQGVLVIAFMGIEWLQEYNVIDNMFKKEWKSFVASLKKLPFVFMPFLGTIGYLIVNYAYTKDAFYFMKLQHNIWGHGFADIYHAMVNLVNNLLSNETDIKIVFAVWIPQIVIFFGVLVLIFCSFKHHRDSISIYLLIYLIISYSTDFLISGGRYMSAAIPLFIILGEMCEKKPLVYKWLVITGVSLMIILMGCHCSGYNMVT